jgi:hypothetical protein
MITGIKRTKRAKETRAIITAGRKEKAIPTEADNRP